MASSRPRPEAALSTWQLWGPSLLGDRQRAAGGVGDGLS